MLVACSGGPDSTALTDALHRLASELGIALVACTVDHGLRAESAEEALRTRAWVESIGVPCELVRLALASGGGVQARARDARYAALRSVARGRACDTIAVAHTLDDQAETVLARIARGSGLRGLAAVAAAREDGVVRPLLGTPRAEVVAYLEHRGIRPMVDDPSNRDARFQRVRVRHELLPTFEREAPRVRASLASLAEEAAEVRAWIEACANAFDVASSDLSVARLRELPAPVRREVWRRWVRHLSSADASRAHLDALEAILIGRGEALLPTGVRVRKHGEWLRGAATTHAVRGRPIYSENLRDEPIEEA